jgi:hypothetical protein
MEPSWREEDFWEAPANNWHSFFVGLMLGGAIIVCLHAIFCGAQ